MDDSVKVDLQLIKLFIGWAELQIKLVVGLRLLLRGIRLSVAAFLLKNVREDAVDFDDLTSECMR